MTLRVRAALRLRGRAEPGRSPATTATAFDLPASGSPGAPAAPGGPGSPEHSGDGPRGVTWDGRRLRSGLRLLPEPVAPGIDLTLLAGFLQHVEIRLASIDVVSRGGTCRGDNPAVSAYRQLLGPLTFAAVRDVDIVFGLDPVANPAALQRRGGDGAGALRTVAATARRLAAALAGAGLASRPLCARELAAVPDAPPAGAFAVDPGAGPAEFGAAADSCWLPDLPVVTTFVRLTGTPGRPAVSAAVCPVRRDGHRPPTPTHPALRRLRDGAAAESPGATVTGDAAREILAGFSPPAGGAGILLGAGAGGNPVSLPLSGPQTPRADLAVRPEVVRRLVVRLLALGRPIAVHTGAPESWRPLAAAVGDVRLLALNPDPAAGPGPAAYSIVVDDRPTGTVPRAATVLRVRAGATAVETGRVPVIAEDPADPARATVHVPGRAPVPITLIGAPAEDALAAARQPARERSAERNEGPEKDRVRRGGADDHVRVGVGEPDRLARCGDEPAW